HADVVLDQAAGRAAFQVDSGGRVAVHAVRHDALAGRLEVVDAVVAVAVAQVAGDQAAVAAGVRLDAGVLVVARDVVQYGVAAAAQVDAGGGPDVLAGVGVRGVADQRVSGRALREVDARVGVVVGRTAADRRVRRSDELEPFGR